jgi:hypothetical protein
MFYFYRHCCQVLGMALFRRAYDLLDATDDNMELEVYIWKTGVHI